MVQIHLPLPTFHYEEIAMSEQSEHKQVIRDEAEAEVAYQKSLAEAQEHAEAIAKDAALSETRRMAAAEAGRALRRVEEARQRAHQEPDPVAAKRTFWDWLRGN
jgi:hypothetical protein